MDKPARIHVHGQECSAYQYMTIRVSLSVFAEDLKQGLASSIMKQANKAFYLEHIQSLEQKLAAPVVHGSASYQCSQDQKSTLRIMPSLLINGMPCTSDEHETLFAALDYYQAELEEHGDQIAENSQEMAELYLRCIAELKTMVNAPYAINLMEISKH